MDTMKNGYINAMPKRELKQIFKDIEFKINNGIKLDSRDEEILLELIQEKQLHWGK